MQNGAANRCIDYVHPSCYLAACEASDGPCFFRALLFPPTELSGSVIVPYLPVDSLLEDSLLEPPRDHELDYGN